MPKMNLDEMAKMLFEEITLTIEGVEYVVGKITADALAISGNANDANAGGHQLAKLLGMKPTTFDKTDLRIIGVAMKYITDEIVKQMEMPVKNSPVVEDTPSG